MKYIFFGTPRFAAIVLEKLLREELLPVALVCNPDRPTGRKKIVTAPQTKELVIKYGKETSVEILQPEKLDENFIEKLRGLKPDFFVVAAYAKIIPKAVLEIPRLGTIGVHPSLLPKYRGAAPIQSAILDGESKTGVTLYLMDEKMDHGPILASEETPSNTLATNYLSLEKTLAEAGADLLAKIMPDFASAEVKPKAQDESQATYTRKFTTDDARVDESDLEAAKNGDERKARDIMRKINAFAQEPGAWTLLGGKRTKLLKAKLENGMLKLLAIQTEGEKAKGI